MAATHRILVDLDEEAFSLIAIHSSLEDYKVVYLVNGNLKTRFARLRRDLDLDQGVSFPIFEWRDVINDRYWTLISNYSRKKEAAIANDLFMNEPSFTTYHLIPEHRDVDYFLKIEGDDAQSEESLVKTLTSIPNIITAYAIDADKLKSKKNLIF
jgi:hypothetical protein